MTEQRERDRPAPTGDSTLEFVAEDLATLEEQLRLKGLAVGARGVDRIEIAQVPKRYQDEERLPQKTDEGL